MHTHTRRKTKVISSSLLPKSGLISLLVNEWRHVQNLKFAQYGGSPQTHVPSACLLGWGWMKRLNFLPRYIPRNWVVYAHTNCFHLYEHSFVSFVLFCVLCFGCFVLFCFVLFCFVWLIIVCDCRFCLIDMNEWIKACMSLVARL